MILQKDPRYESGIWKKELEVFSEIKKKSRIGGIFKIWSYKYHRQISATKIRTSKKSVIILF